MFINGRERKWKVGLFVCLCVCVSERERERERERREGTVCVGFGVCEERRLVPNCKAS